MALHLKQICCIICDKNPLRMQKRLDENKIFLRVKHKTFVLESPLPNDQMIYRFKECLAGLIREDALLGN
ncbi:MAG: hypothetical protein PWQ60_2218 [Thermoanaerobacteraceae bacterium]|nr:hypothetical protein [Thermoanaerobacteraceae bacterium]